MFVWLAPVLLEALPLKIKKGKVCSSVIKLLSFILTFFKYLFFLKIIEL